MTHYYLNVITKLTYSLAILSLLWTSSANAEDLTKECVNCFSTEIVSITSEDDCTTIQLDVSAYDCIHALSHLTIEVPCGTISSASNSKGWPMEINSEDPTTGIWGIKIDDIQNFGENGEAGTFTIEYTVCYTDHECKNLIESGFDIAYKASTCIFIDQIEPETSSLDAFLTTTDILCSGAEDGQVITTITEGTEPFTYLWDNGATTKDLQGVVAGTYEVTITDATGESLTLSAQINQPEALSAQASVINANCGFNDGAISVTVSGGVEPYTYEWSNGSTTSSADQLQSGQYTLLVSDANNCVKTFSYTVQSTTTLRATITSDVLECHQEGEGSLTVTPTGGEEPYTYLWDNGDTTATASNLTSGMHKVIITDAVGCSVEKSSYVIIKKLEASAYINNPKCNGDSTGSATLTINNGTEPYDIVWQDGSKETTIDDLPGGWYWADISDANGCTVRKYVNISEPAAIHLNASYSRSSCSENDSSIVIDLNANGGTPPYIFYKDDTVVDGSYIVDQTGYYQFTVVDTNGCEKTDSVLVTRPDASLNSDISVTQPNCKSNNYGSAVITIVNGVSPFTVSWSDGSEAMNRNDLSEGEYEVIITDNIGCSSQHTISITSIELASAEIIAPDIMPECSSSGNMLYAFTNNAASFEWTFSDAGWKSSSETADQITYSAGEGNTWVKLSVTSSDNCTAVDSIQLSCQGVDDSTPTDSIPDDGGEKNCDICYQIIPTDIKKVDDNCYQYSLTIKTDGTCSFDLSHLTVEVKEGYVKSVYNSKGWKIEANSTDPTTGIYGFKIDDISNFGKSPDQFNIVYTICFDGNYQRDFTVAYKSAQCVVTDEVSFKEYLSTESIIGSSYPNPFTDATQIEFISKKAAYAKLCIYDIYGSLVECLYEGQVDENTYYNFEFRPANNQESIFFYRLVSGDEIIQGKLMKIR